MIKRLLIMTILALLFMPLPLCSTGCGGLSDITNGGTAGPGIVQYDQIKFLVPQGYVAIYDPSRALDYGLPLIFIVKEGSRAASARIQIGYDPVFDASEYNLLKNGSMGKYTVSSYKVKSSGWDLFKLLNTPLGEVAVFGTSTGNLAERICRSIKFLPPNEHYLDVTVWKSHGPYPIGKDRSDIFYVGYNEWALKFSVEDAQAKYSPRPLYGAFSVSIYTAQGALVDSDLAFTLKKDTEDKLATYAGPSLPSFSGLKGPGEFYIKVNSTIPGSRWEAEATATPE